MAASAGTSSQTKGAGQHFKKGLRRRPHSWHSSMGFPDRRLHGKFIHSIKYLQYSNNNNNNMKILLFMLIVRTIKSAC